MTDHDFYGFSPPLKQDWIDQALKDTGAKHFNELLVWDDFEQIEYAPFYTEEDSHSFPRKISDSRQIPENPQRHQWENVSSINLDTDPAETVTRVLGLGIDGIVVQWSGSGNLDDLLPDLQPEYLTIWLMPMGEVDETVSAFLEWARKKLPDPQKLRGGVIWDAWAESGHSGGSKQQVAAQVVWLHSVTKDFPEFKGLCLDFSYYQKKGFNVSEELILGLGVFIEVVDVLTEKGFYLKEVEGNLFVFLGIGKDYFLQIAKLKALRILFEQLTSLYSGGAGEGGRFSVQIFSTTGMVKREEADVYKNMVRNTMEAMMAILGGTHTLWVQEHTEDKSSVFPKRIAANISNLLQYESHFDRRGDATEGTFYLEYLMDTLLAKVKKGLLEQEAVGGWYGMLPRIAEARKSSQL